MYDCEFDDFYIHHKLLNGSIKFNDKSKQLKEILENNGFIAITEHYNERGCIFYVNIKEILYLSREASFINIDFRKASLSDNNNKLTILTQMDDFTFDILKYKIKSEYELHDF